MIPNYYFQWTCRGYPRLLLLMCLALAAGVPTTRAAQVDASFTPPSNYQSWFWFLRAFDRKLYVSGGPPEIPFSRLNDDGSLDSAWELKSPVTQAVSEFIPGPSGGFLLRTLFGSAYWEQAAGTFARLPGVNIGFGSTVFLMDDGSVILKDFDFFIRLNPEGREDLNYRANTRMQTLLSTNPNGSGAKFSSATADSRGRLIVVGNFDTVGGVERLGLVRFLADGSPDPTWNPGSALGISPTNFSAGRPYSVSLGRNDEVLVGIEYQSINGVVDRRMALVSEQGTVNRVFPDFGDVNSARIVQPDGRVIVAGNGFREWNGVPVECLVRLEPDGTLDSSFRVDFDPPGSQISGAFLDDEGRLYISGGFQSINGIKRPRLARLIAFVPKLAAPQIELQHAKPRIGTNELLFLTARVTGSPAPELQWYRNGQPLPDERYPGLRLPITNATDVGEFRLVAQNSEGTQELNFGQVDLGVRSPRPGLSWTRFSGPLGDLGQVTQILPLHDGRILCSLNAPRLGDTYPLIACFTADGRLDLTFGTNGVIQGAGLVELLQVSTTGTILVAGYFESWAGAPASGLVELSTSGQRLSRAFPLLDPPSVTAVLELPDGRWLIAGRFSQVNSAPAFRLARLKADFSWDSSFDASSIFIPYQMVNTLALDPQGRVLAGGANFNSEGSLTNPIPLGLVRLLENGTADPAFQLTQHPVYSIQGEPDGTLVTGFPFRRWSLNGELLRAFPFDLNSFNFGTTDHRSARLPNGQWIHQIRSRANSGDRLMRWRPDGSFDELFEDRFSSNRTPTQITAIAALADGSALVGIMGSGSTSLERLLPDADQQPSMPTVSGAELQAGLFTQPGRSYVIRHRSSLTGTPHVDSPVLPGDGYRTPFSAPVDAGEGYWEILTTPPTPH